MKLSDLWSKTKSILPVTLGFPNQSRSYDPRRQRVRFSGHDGAFEVCFFVEQGVFSRINPDAKLDEAGILHEFDRYRDRILQAASRMYYSRQRRDTYTLLASDF
jgi:hypothetical protein